jgi:hypothetical protein
MGWNNVAIDYLKTNDDDTTQVITDLAAHIAAADPHPQYTTDAEATVIAQTEGTKISNTMTFLLMGA